MSLQTDSLFKQLKQVQPDYKKVVRLNILVWALIICGAVGFVSFLIGRANDNLFYALIVFIPLALFLFLFLIYPKKVYKYTHFGLVDEVFYVQKGWLFKKRTAVSQNRIQHTDVEQGPFLRKYGLAQLILHTAGVKEADISISGLDHAEAIAIRDHLLEMNKQKIRRTKTQSSSPKQSNLIPSDQSIASSVLALNPTHSSELNEEE